MKTLHCMHQEDWMCPECCKCSVCCTCESHEHPLVHVNSLAAANAWRATTHGVELSSKEFQDKLRDAK